jgi:hypothetical protein
MSMFLIDILEGFLGKSSKHNESKGQLAFDCPACAVEGDGIGKHNLELNYKRGIFRCWSCMYKNNMHGHVPKLIKRFGNAELLREYLVLKPDTYENTGAGEYDDVKMPEGYKKLHDCPKNSPKYHEVMKYLSDRRIGPDIIEKFNIGYTLTGEFKNRIIIPSYDSFGELNYFIARAFSYRTKPKYLNPEAEKQEIIFNEDKINWDATIYLVEGVFDHIVIPNSIPLLGKFVSSKLFNELYNKASANIVILLDADAYDDSIELYKTLNIGDLHGKIRLCVPLDGYDPSLIYQKWSNHGIIELLKASRKIPESQLY